MGRPGRRAVATVPAEGILSSMKISVELSPSQVARLQDRAKSLGVVPEDLARAAVADLLANPDEDFRVVAETVLQKNAPP
jgi:hypothetical protein